MVKPFVNFSSGDRLKWSSPLDVLIELFRWLLILGFTFMILAFLESQLSQRPGHRAHQLNEGWLQISDSPLLPAGNAGHWQAVELPDDWRLQDRREASQVWYQFTLTLEESNSELWAVYLPGLTMNASVYINGEQVGAGGRFEPRVARNWSRPLYFTVPGSLLRAGKNSVMVRVTAKPAGTGLLTPLYLGPDNYIRSYYQSRHFLKVTVPVVTSLATGLLALAALLIYYSRREGSVYRWFGIGTLIWSIHNLNPIVVDPPVPAVIWDWLWFVSMGWFILMIPPYIHGILGYHRPTVEKALFAYGATGTIALAAIGAYDHYWMDWAGRHIWDSIALLIGVYPTVMMMQAVWHSRDIEIQWLLTTGLLIFILGCRDALVINDLLPRVDGYAVQYSAPLVIAVFGWLLLSRFVRSIGEVEALNEDLHQRVEERSDALKKSFEKVSAMERHQAIQTERERILRDMHDGVGGSLAAAVAVAESGSVSTVELAESLRESLEELRLTIDSLDLEQGDLAAAFGNLRARLRHVLNSAKPVLHWHCDDLPDMPQLGPEGLTDLVRIVREAISNALRHAQASDIWLRTRVEGNRLRLEIEDNGEGIESLDQSGHGLANMRRRAETLGANIEILSSRSGTKIILLITIQTGTTKT